MEELGNTIVENMSKRKTSTKPYKCLIKLGNT
jgi:hypothetical protein